ncbi:hypothetical protein [Elizabethkingia anophelis]|uniref:Uncharacterized protein n=1 Tax=Elizabethkingia anophelis TaxID=1117645 RepID=A0A7Z7LU38_9FLAO|nr:hypothetical protein [Elizabethkingia anophelis]MDV3630452.1 hypothetical protein [Elizabethkingia anophelis]MDV3704736.1 hypothetical protein [Elizabethkingia anophelis]MDV3722952.1 hypothetical protein [Elizabethkingia anophelis]STC97729.1 Uncharacterised protein [Elizabethkingia anophelis]
MEGKELRLGNFVMCRNFPVFGHNIPVDWSVAQVSAEGIAIADKFEPIPITDEWLIKLGFEKSYSSSNCTKTTNGYKLDFAGGEVLYLDSVRLKHIKYVHQLQNLYFALTGKELTIKS